MVYASAFIFCLLGSAAAWFVTRWFGDREMREKMAVADAKLRLAEGRAGELKEKLKRALASLENLRRKAEEEALNRATLLEKTAAGFRKRAAILACSALAVGVLSGGLAGILSARTDARGFEIRALAAEAKTEFYREQLDVLRAENGVLRERLFGEMEARALASAKLAVLLAQDLDRKEESPGGSFLTRLKEKWGQDSLPEPSTVMAIPVKTV